MFVPITDQAEIASAYDRLVEQLTINVTPIRKWVGWPSGRSEYDVYWRADEGLWCLFDPKRTRNRFWCCFGPNDPSTVTTLSISCEINFARSGVNRRIAGALLRDGEGRLYVAHSGKVAGGRKGVGKDNFLRYYDSPVKESVSWPDGRTTDMLIVGMLDSDTFVPSVAAFVSQVASFKDDIRNGVARERELPRVVGADHDSELADYSPESLLGLASFDQKTRKIEMRLAHGPVVHALREAVEGAGLLAKKNNRIDLAALSSTGELLTIFEVKTGVDWGSVYGAIGQLMYHGKTGAREPQRLVAVLPQGGPTDLDTRLAAIGLGVVRYEYANGRPVFTGLDLALQ